MARRLYSTLSGFPDSAASRSEPAWTDPDRAAAPKAEMKEAKKPRAKAKKQAPAKKKKKTTTKKASK